MSQIIISCPNCGETDSTRIKSDENGMLLCSRCNVKSYIKTVESEYKHLKKLLSEQSMAEYNNSLQNLFSATNVRYPNKETVLSYAAAVKKHNPDHIFANLYELLLHNSTELADLINKIALDKTLTDDQRIYTAIICIKNLSTHIITAVNHFIETNFDGKIQEDLYSQLEEQAVVLQEGIYDVNLNRDVFIAHSGKDKQLMEKLVKSLENSGFKCFISTRNLRHGINAGSEYETNLEKAMDNCSVFLLINTTNARDVGCDVRSFEIPYIKKREKEKFPQEYSYAPLKRVPVKYKKPRINYLVDGYGASAYDVELKEFFSGFEDCKSIKKVESMLNKWKSGGVAFEDNTNYKDPNSIRMRMNSLMSQIERECDKFVPAKKKLLELENNYKEADGQLKILKDNPTENTKSS